MRKLFFIIIITGTSLYLYLFGFHRPKTLWTSKYRITDRKLNEVSGAVFSVKNPDLIWLHNDGRRLSGLFLTNRKGRTVKRFKSDVTLHDWEDIAIQIDKKGNSYLYAGDIGDNYRDRSCIQILKFNEPSLTDNQIEDSISVRDTLFLRYPDGPRDAEAMFIDPVSNNLYIISKREANPHIYGITLPEEATDTLVLEKKGELHIKGVKILGWVTAAAISSDGSQILLRTYSKVYYWTRLAGETVEKAMTREPFDLPHVKELQGEAICFTPESDGFYTVSEGKFPYLNYNQIKLK
nr:hypothetical protein [uncultured bacterium]